MKPNYFYHPLTKLLCLVLCVASFLMCAYFGMRMFYIESLGMMDGEPQFYIDTFTYDTRDDLYWPQGWYGDFLADDYYYSYGDALAYAIQAYLCSDETMKNALSAEDENAPFPELIVTQTDKANTLIYPSVISEELMNFIQTHHPDNGNFRFRLSIGHVSGENTVFFSNTGEERPFSEFVIGNTYGTQNIAILGNGYYKELRLEYGIASSLDVYDAYATFYHQWANDASSWEMYLLSFAGTAVCALGFLVCVLCQAGMRWRMPGVVYLTKFDRLPYEITLAAQGALLIGAVLLFSVFVGGYHHAESNFFNLLFGYTFGSLREWLLPMAAIAIAFLFIVLAISVLCEAVRRYRGGKWWHNTLIWRLLRCCFGVCRRFNGLCRTLFANLPTLWRWLIGCTLFVLWTLLVMGTHVPEVLWFLSALVLGILGALWILQLDTVKRGAEKITSGQLHHHISTEKMIGTPKTLAESMNRIGEATQCAVEERMKSERFRSELITNVSHDLKTPLTSIINYTDLLSKEECENETMREYIDILCRQSARLKKLTEDLLEASKASSGTVAVTLAPTDAAELLTQAIGEYEERFRKGNLILMVDIKEQPLMIMADGKHLWRVFDNLLSNICKYSLSGTRVYLRAAMDGGDVVLSFRNISAEVLSVDANELTERFVRGDASRHTEGSGLGLAIADSLTTLQGGRLTLTTDGDLFKAEIRFSHPAHSTQ